MADNDTQRAILDAEFYWFGGQLGAPKVYDSGTSFNAHPALRGSAAPEAVEEIGSEPPLQTDRIYRYSTDGSHWSVTFDGA